MHANRPPLDALTLEGLGGLYNGETFLLEAGLSATAGASSLATFPASGCRNYRRLAEQGGLEPLLSRLAPEHVRFLYVGEDRLIVENLAGRDLRVGQEDVSDRIDLDLSRGPVTVWFAFGEKLVARSPGSGPAVPDEDAAPDETEYIESLFAVLLVPDGEPPPAFPADDEPLGLAGEAATEDRPETKPDADAAADADADVDADVEEATLPAPRRRWARPALSPSFYFSLLLHVVVILGLFSYISTNLIVARRPVVAEIEIVKSPPRPPAPERTPSSEETPTPGEPTPDPPVTRTMNQDDVPPEPFGDFEGEREGEDPAASPGGAGIHGILGLGPRAGQGPASGVGNGSARPGLPGRSGDPDGAIARALGWLRRHQLDDGSWRGISSVKESSIHPSAGNREYTVALTGLATLAFVRAGYTHQVGEYRDTVRKAARFLTRRERSSGGFHSPHMSSEEREMYGNALATMALAELFRASGFPVLKGLLEREARFIERQQVPYAGWRYRPAARTSDTSVTGWQVLALSSLERAGLRVNPATWAGALTWLDEMTEPGTSRVGYSRRGRGSLAMTATGVALRLLMDEERGADPVRGGMKILAANPPTWPTTGGSSPPGNPPDIYYWYFGTLAAEALGGSFRTHWNQALGRALLPHQHTEGSDRGSWTPPGRWTRVGGRVMATALAALTLEASYRK